MIEQRENEHKVIRMAELEKTIYKLESENKGLKSSLDTLQVQLVESKENEDHLQQILNKRNLSMDKLENQLQVNVNTLGEVY